MGKIRLSAGIVALLVSLGPIWVSPSAAAAPSRPHVTCTGPQILPDLGYGAAASAENHHGTITGIVGRADGSLHAAVWQRGELKPSFDTGFVQSTALDVNDRGLVLGQGLRRTDRVRVGWLWNGTTLTLLPLPAGTTLTMVRRLNQRGDVVGTVQTQQGLEFAVRWAAPRYRPQILPPVPGDVGSFGHGINNRGTAAGSTDLDGRDYPVLWDRRGRIEVLPSPGGAAEAWVINNAGQVAGYGWTSNNPADRANERHALFWDTRHRVHDLGELPGANDTESLGIAQNGWVVGYSASVEVSTDEVRFSYGWVWPHAGPLIQLPTPAGQMSIAHDLIENGTVVGAVGADVGPPVSRLAVWQCRP
jgi:uncharacterized membrane protein